jgi:uncharacterized protein (DUF58 family)
VAIYRRAIDPGRGLAARAAVVAFILALASAASLISARYCLSGITYRRRLASRYLSLGEETELDLEITNAKPLPLASLKVRDKFPQELRLLTGGPARPNRLRPAWLVSLVSLRWFQRVVRTHRIRGERRGRYRLGPALLSAGDFFGAQRRQIIVPGTDTLVVFPRIVPVSALRLPAGRPGEDWLARRRIIEDPLRFAAVREYVPGDNPRHIHWHASAHTGALQTRLYDPADTVTLALALDVQTSPVAFERIPNYVELLITAAASLAVDALEARHSVGLYANAMDDDGGALRIDPGRHPQQATALLAALAGLTGLHGAEFPQLLLTLLPVLPYGATVAALTALPDDAVYEALAALREAGHGVLLLTVGEAAPTVPPQIESHHLGGHDAWHRLETLELA